MATGAKWSAILSINDKGARATINNIGDAAREMGNQFGGNLMKATSAFSLMKFALDVCVDSAKQLIKESKELIQTSRRFDVPMEKIGGMKRMAEDAGSSIGSLGGAYKELEMNINNAIMRPGKGAARTFEKLGMSKEDIMALSKDTDAAFMIMIEKLRGIEDEGQRAAAAQDMFGGSAQEALNYVKMNAEQLQASRDASYEYSNSLTQANSEITNAFSDISEAIKPLGQLFASIFGVLVTLLNMAIQGVKFLGMGIMDFISGILSRVGGVLQGIIMGVTGGIQLIYYKGKNALGLMSDKEYDAKKQAIEADMSAEADRINAKFSKPMFEGKKYDKQLRNMGNATQKFDQELNAVGESIGFAGYDEGSKAQVEGLENKRKTLRGIADDKRRSIAELKKSGDTEGLNEEMKALAIIDDEISATTDEIKEIELRARKAGAKGVGEKKGKGGTEYKSNELEDMAEAQRLKEQELMYERRRQQAPKEFRDAVELGILTEKRLKAEEELAAITEANNKNKKTSNTDIARQYELQNKLLAAQNAELGQVKKMTDDAVESNKMMTEAARTRKNEAIEEIQKREQFAMKKSGTSAIDRQTISLNQEIEKLKRDQEEFDYKNQRQLYSPQEREAAKGKLQKQTFAATGSLDKLMAMQFNFSASDAAKAGMGGGITEQKNLVDINTEMLSYLKKMYQQQLEGNKIEGKPFQYDPLTLRGKSIDR